MGTRYNNRQITRNKNKLYKKHFEDRNVTQIRQFRTPELSYPTPDEIRQLNVLTHVWKTGDRYFKLADQYYQRPELWWVIAHYNKKPSESSVNLGDVILIPTPIDAILYYL